MGKHLPVQLERGTVNDARWGVADLENRMMRAETVGINRATLIASVFDDPGVFGRAERLERMELLADVVVEWSRGLRIVIRELRAQGSADLANQLDGLQTAMLGAVDAARTGKED